MSIGVFYLVSVWISFGLGVAMVVVFAASSEAFGGVGVGGHATNTVSRSGIIFLFVACVIAGPFLVLTTLIGTLIEGYDA